jgi:hypothetical protein
MAHPKDDEIYPEGTIVRFKKTNEFCKILKPSFRYYGTGFQHYEAEIEGRDNSKGFWVLYHDEIELEALPPGYKQEGTKIIYRGI